MKTTTLRANDKIRAALAARMPPTAAEVFKPLAAPPPPEPKKPEPPRQLNEFEIAGRARRAAHRSRLLRARLLREKLVEMFPDCFKPLGQSVVPLKVGIHRDVLAALPDISRNDLKLMLGTYVRAEGYRQGLVEGAVRFDLAGNPSGAVTAQEARWPPQK